MLAVDDEPPALDELLYLLRNDPRVEYVHSAADAAEALRVLHESEVDVAFLDIRMPGLDGMDLARVLQRFARSPAIVFVTAYDDRAADAFDLGVVDYVRKPVRAERIAESLRRVLSERAAVGERAAAAPEAAPTGDPMIPVELGGVVRLLPRSSVCWVEAQGDYARLHTTEGSHLVRVSLTQLEERWTDAGFLRIHRSYLVRLDLVTELRLTGSGYVVTVEGRQLPVARRHTRALKDRLIRPAKQHWH
ncbi:DNA-binding response regulator [Catellatospora sp. IY07-71]|nr:DNA-binding response regulator [Catellatospora sp. IY07-71]